MTDAEQRQLVTPVCLTLASAIFVALLVNDALEIDAGHLTSTAHYTSTRNAAMAAGVRALAEMLGLVGSIAVGGAVIALMALWVGLSYRRIVRARPAALRRA